jgi:hypothetical protein
LSEANAVRQLANVLMRMPNHATPYEPRMPSTEKARMVTTLHRVHVLQHAEVVDDAGADEDLEHHEQLALLEQIGLARLIDGVRTSSMDLWAGMALT